MNRKEFLKITTALLGGFGIQATSSHRALAVDHPKSNVLDDSYLEKGLTGMARAGGWFEAHWGASVLAGYYLCQENNLGQETIAAIRKQLDAMIRLRASQFTPLPEEPANQALIETVPKALAPAVQGGLRAHGHAVIFASLSLKALRDAPHMAQPKLLEGLCRLSQQIAKKDPQPADNQTPYADTSTMIEATLNSLARFKDLLGRPSVRRPNFTHMTTHTEALMNLERMGYGDLAKAGHPGLRVHIGAPVPDYDPMTHPRAVHHATLEEIMSKDYWANEGNLARWNRKWEVSSNPNGYWVAFGHLFKVLYSFHRLIGGVTDQKKIRLCSSILLERYINPEVQGG